MTLSNFQRGNCVKSEIEFKMNDVLTDPSGNKAFIDVIKPDGTYLVENGDATRSSTGKYLYYFETESTDPLGIYVTIWKGMHSLGGSYGYKNIVRRKAINIIYEND